MNLKPNVLGPLISHLQNNTMDNNNKNNYNDAINAEMTKHILYSSVKHRLIQQCMKYYNCFAKQQRN